MPSKSPAQAHLMAAVAHGWHKPGGGGPSVSVAKEFNNADQGVHAMKGYHGKAESFAAGGAVLGRTKDFMKTEDKFRSQQYKPAPKTDEVFGKGAPSHGDTGISAPPVKGKSLPMPK